MALIKGNRPVKKTEKKKMVKEDDTVYPYLKSKPMTLMMRYSSLLHFIPRSLFLFNILIAPMYVLIWDVVLVKGGISTFPFWLLLGSYPLFYILAYRVFTIEGLYRYYLSDGPSFMQTGTLLSPRNPSPGAKLPGTQLVTSRFLVVPGPESSYNGFIKKAIPAFLFLSLIPLGVIALHHSMNKSELIIIVDLQTHVALTVLLFVVSSLYLVWSYSNPLYPPRRFFIFDRKNQTISYHPSFWSRRMITRPWIEYEGRTVTGHHGGYSCQLNHAPTGQMAELKTHDSHWHKANAVEAYSYVARFMDLSQSLPDEPEFERYLPEEENYDHIEDEDEKIRMFFKASAEKEARREKYHNPDADVVLGNIKSFSFSVEEYPWLSAKNVWIAAHKYNQEPNWDKWVRDKWGLAANENYQVPEDQKEGEPYWFAQFFDLLKTNTRKIESMDDDERIKYFQDWFEETFPELHWVDPVTADCYEQEEEFLG